MDKTVSWAGFCLLVNASCDNAALTVCMGSHTCCYSVAAPERRRSIPVFSDHDQVTCLEHFENATFAVKNQVHLW